MRARAYAPARITANGGHMVEAAQNVMADFMLRTAEASDADA
jgi:hypothetical protein